MRVHRAVAAVVVAIALAAALNAPVGAQERGSRPSAQASANAQLQMNEAVVDAATADRLRAEGYEIVSSEQGQDSVRIVLVLYPWQRTAVEKQGIDLSLWTNTEGVTATDLAAQQQSAGFKVWRDYDGSDGIRAYLDQVAAANPDLLKLEVIGQTHGTDPEGDGPDVPRDIVAL